MSILSNLAKNNLKIKASQPVIPSAFGVNVAFNADNMRFLYKGLNPDLR